MKQFILQFAAFVFLLVGISMCLPQIFPHTTLLVPFYYYLVLFMAVLSLSSFAIVYYSNRSNPQAGVNGMMISIGLKLFLSMIIIFIIAKKVRPDKVLFILNFFSLYLLFSVFEISAMLRNLRHQNLRKKS